MAVTTKEKSDAIQTNMLRNRCGSNYRIPATDVTGPMDWPPLRIFDRRIRCDVRDLTKPRPKAEAEYRLGLTSSAGKLLLVHVARRADMSV